MNRHQWAVYFLIFFASNAFSFTTDMYFTNYQKKNETINQIPAVNKNMRSHSLSIMAFCFLRYRYKLKGFFEGQICYDRLERNFPARKKFDSLV